MKKMTIKKLKERRINYRNDKCLNTRNINKYK